MHAIMIDNAFDIPISIYVFGFLQASSPTVRVIETDVITVLESCNASSVVLTVLFFCLTVFLDAFLRSIQDDSNLSLLETIIGLSTFCDINSSLTSL